MRNLKWPEVGPYQQDKEGTINSQMQRLDSVLTETLAITEVSRTLKPDELRAYAVLSITATSAEITIPTGIARRIVISNGAATDITLLYGATSFTVGAGLTVLYVFTGVEASSGPLGGPMATTTFLGLANTPSSYAGASGLSVIVDALGTGLEFAVAGGGGSSFADGLGTTAVNRFHSEIQAAATTSTSAFALKGLIFDCYATSNIASITMPIFESNNSENQIAGLVIAELNPATNAITRMIFDTPNQTHISRGGPSTGFSMVYNLPGGLSVKKGKRYFIGLKPIVTARFVSALDTVAVPVAFPNTPCRTDSCCLTYVASVRQALAAPAVSDVLTIFDTTSTVYMNFSEYNEPVLERSQLSMLKSASSYTSSTPTADAVVLKHVYPAFKSFDANMNTSKAKAGVAATSSTVFNVNKNGVNIGTLTFSAAGTTGVFAITATEFAQGDILEIVAPTTPDATLAQIKLIIG